MAKWLIYLFIVIGHCLYAQCIDLKNAQYINIIKFDSLTEHQTYKDTFILCNPTNETHYHELSTRYLANVKVKYGIKEITPIAVNAKSYEYMLILNSFSQDTFIISYNVNEAKAQTGIFIASHEQTLTNFKTNSTISANAHNFFQSTFLGFLLTMLLLVLIYYKFLHHKYFLDYSFYLASIFIFFILRYYMEPMYFKSNYSEGDIAYKLSHVMQCFFYVGYFSFVRSFLNTKNNRKYLDLLSKYTVWFSIASAIILTFLLFYAPREIAILYFTIYRFIIAIVAITCILISLYNMDRLVIFVVIGSTFLVIGSLLAMYYSMVPKSEKLGWGPMYYMQVGMLIEFIFFNIGIGYKTYQLSEEKHEVSNKLITSLQENELLSKNKEVDLQHRIAEVTYQIKEAEKQNLETAYALKSKEMEMQILRSQINPHFMFNTINALKSLTMQHKYEEVGEYFDEFSKLLRLFLENSRSKKISLSKELKALELFVLFENLRLRYKIKLDIIIDPVIDPHFTEVPPTILQPFVENAIKHGLSPKEKDGGTITISIVQLEDEALKISIIDNGIGRKTAMLFNSNSDHNSLGIKIIEERLSLLIDSNQPKIEIIDLHNDSNEPIGTQVDLYVY